MAYVNDDGNNILMGGPTLRKMLLSGLALGLIGVAIYYLSTPAHIAAPAPVLAGQTEPKPGPPVHTGGLQWMGELPPSAIHKQQEPRLYAEMITALAATRNPADALHAYQIIDVCDSLRDMLELDPLPPGLLPQKKQCASITEVTRRSKYDYLNTAAYAGIPGAGSEWLRNGPSGDREALRSRPNDPLVIEWKKQASALVLRDGDQGNFNALQDLMSGYAGKTPFFGVDPSRELAYATAYKEVVDLLQVSVPNQPTDAELAALAAKLSPEQVAWAKAKAKAIIAARGNRVAPAIP
jgi:hypothetical protein